MTVSKRELPPTGILQEWVSRLGLREQGVLLTAVRGCDTAPRHDASKDLTRAIRGEILNTHCANPAEALSFIEKVDTGEIYRRVEKFRKNLDHYPHHFVMHIIHAIEVLAHRCPEDGTWNSRPKAWEDSYCDLCRGLHMRPETLDEMSERLNADEISFGVQQQ